MNKFFSTLLVVVCSFLVLASLSSLSVFIPEMFSNPTHSEAFTSAIPYVVFFLVLLALSAWGVWFGLKKQKQGKKHEVVSFDRVLDIELNGKLDFKEYRKLILGLSFKRPLMMIYLLIIFINFVFYFLDEDSGSSPNYFLYIFPLAFLFVLYQVIAQTKRQYESNKVFHEQVNYKLNNESIQMKGETFETSFKWTHFYQLKETSRFILLYQNNIIATLLDKELFSKEQLEEFKGFLASQPYKRI